MPRIRDPRRRPLTPPDAPDPARLAAMRQAAASFGGDVDRYDRSRQRYPEALVAAIADGARAVAPSGQAPRVLDVGIGTGIVARQLRDAGCEVLGVDVDERMAERARRDGFVVDVAPFEDWGPAGRLVDAVTAGQTWHWVDPDAGAARAAQVLRQGGALSVFWNAGDPPAEVAEAFAAVYRDVLPGSPMAAGGTGSAAEAYDQMADRAALGMRRSGAFGEPVERRDAWERTWTTAQWLDWVPTTGMVTRLPPTTLQTLLDGLGAAVDAAGGSFVQRGLTLAVSAART